MTIHLWNTNRLAVALAQRKVSADEKFVYLVISWSIGAAAGYLGSLFVVASGGWLFWYEGLLVLGVTVFGLIRCRDKYQGTDDRLLEHCVVLSAPLNLKYFFFTWLAFITASQFLHWIISNLSFTSDSPASHISFLLNAVNTFYPFLISVIGILLYYIRLSVHLKTIAAGTSSRRMG